MNNPADVLFRLFDAWKSGDVEAYVGCFADTFESAHPLGRTTDHGHIRKEVEKIVEHWGDCDYRIIEKVTQGDMVAVEYEMSMTGKGRGFEGRIVLPGLALARIRDDRIVKYREEFDPKVVMAARMKRA
jgi:ketosteroid isomerase-like protein